MSAIYGEGLYGELIYGGEELSPELIALWEARCLAAIPANYKTADNLAVFKGMIRTLAEELARTDQTLTRMASYFEAVSAPEEFLRWIIAEFFGWVLIPDGYPVDPRGEGIQSSPCLRRLLANLAIHYQRRSTVAGVQTLLREFGIISQVYDRSLYAGGYVGTFGGTPPKRVRVRILGYEPFFFPRNTFIGGYLGHVYPHTTRQIITSDFVHALCNWSRAAGVHFLIEWEPGTQPTFDTAHIADDDEITID